jgi:transposase
VLRAQLCGWGLAEEAVVRVRPRQDGDLERLLALAAQEPDQAKRLRYLAVARVLAGESTAVIQEALSRSRTFVQRWAYAYRDGGIEALGDKAGAGSSRLCPASILEAARLRVESRPNPKDIGGKQLRSILSDLGVEVSTSTAYRLLREIRMRRAPSRGPDHRGQ